MRRVSRYLVLATFWLLGLDLCRAAAPVVFQQLQGAVAAHGSFVTLQAVVKISPPFTYNWKHGSQVVTSGTSIVYGNAGGSAAVLFSCDIFAENRNAGTYQLTVGNADGQVTSGPVTLTVLLNPPHLVSSSDPVNSLPDPSATTTLSVSVSGFAPFTYQWQKNGRNYGSPVVSYETDSSIIFPSVAASSGSYRCVISNQDGSTSTVIPVHFYAVPTAVQWRQHLVMALSSSATLNFTFYSNEAATGYQWQFNGKNIPGANEDHLDLTPVSLAEAGDYRVIVQTESGAHVSDATSVALVDTSPQNPVGAAGKTATLTARAAGKNLSFAWHKMNSSDPLPAPHYSGQNTAKLNIVKAGDADTATAYWCTVWHTGDTSDNVTTGTFSLALESLPPLFDTVSFDDGIVAIGYAVQLSANGSITKYAASNLPAGLACDSATGLISGAPLVPGIYRSIKVSATNPVGTTTIGPFTMTVTAYPVDFSGTFVGPLFSEVSEPFGTMSLSVARSGAYSGKVYVTFDHGVLRTYSFKGVMQGSELGVTGSSTAFTLNDTFFSSVIGPHNVLVSWTPGNGIQASLSPTTAENPFATFTPYRNTWKAVGNPATNFAGYYTTEILHIGGPEDARGSGYATFTVKTDGTLTFAGRLHDGTAFAVPTFLDGNSAWVHAWLYGYKGQMQSVISIAMGMDPNHLDNSIGGALNVVRPPSTVKLPGDATVNNAYFNGVTMTCSVTGAPYLRPGKGLLGSGAYMMDATGSQPNILVDINLGLSGPVVSAASLKTNHVATFPAFPSGSPAKFNSLSFNSLTGLFSGSFTEYVFNDDQKISAAHTLPFQGVVTRFAPDQPRGYGAGYFIRSFTEVVADPAKPTVTVRVPLIVSGDVAISVN